MYRQLPADDKTPKRFSQRGPIRVLCCTCFLVMILLVSIHVYKQPSTRQGHASSDPTESTQKNPLGAPPGLLEFVAVSDQTHYLVNTAFDVLKAISIVMSLIGGLWVAGKQACGFIKMKFATKDSLEIQLKIFPGKDDQKLGDGELEYLHSQKITSLKDLEYMTQERTKQLVDGLPCVLKRDALQSFVAHTKHAGCSHLESEAKVHILEGWAKQTSRILLMLSITVVIQAPVMIAILWSQADQRSSIKFLDQRLESKVSVGSDLVGDKIQGKGTSNNTSLKKDMANIERQVSELKALVEKNNIETAAGKYNITTLVNNTATLQHQIAELKIGATNFGHRLDSEVSVWSNQMKTLNRKLDMETVAGMQNITVLLNSTATLDQQISELKSRAGDFGHRLDSEVSVRSDQFKALNQTLSVETVATQDAFRDNNMTQVKNGLAELDDLFNHGVCAFCRSCGSRWPLLQGAGPAPAKFKIAGMARGPDCSGDMEVSKNWLPVLCCAEVHRENKD